MLNISNARKDISNVLDSFLSGKREKGERVFRREIRTALKDVCAAYSKHAEQGEKISRQIVDEGMRYAIEFGWKSTGNKRQKCLEYNGNI